MATYNNKRGHIMYQNAKEYAVEYANDCAWVNEHLGLAYSLTGGTLAPEKDWNNQLVHSWKATFTDTETGRMFETPFHTGEGWQVATETGTQPKKPSPLDVLCSMYLDNPQGMDFEEWCNDMDMDTDSRKALAMYEHLQQQADNFAQAFPTLNLEDFEEITNR